MATLSEIERVTKEFSDARRALSDKVGYLEEEIATLRRKYLPGIRRAVDAAAEKQSALYAVIEESADLFVKPRTIIFHGIKIGYQKKKGTITWEDEGQVIKLIKKHFPDQEDILIRTAEEPVKTALAQLSVQDLKKLGVTVVDTSDEVVIKPTDSEIDKLVKALLEEELKEVKEAA